jgi:heme A synthase
MRINRFGKFAWFVLGYIILVILWGAFVRATGSGAGCGSHWPLCNGEVIPYQPQIETIIEFTHRLMSGLALILVVVLCIWGFRAYSKGHPVRLGVSFSLFFIITESLVGAGLVLLELVADDASVGRAISIVVHLLNTFLLLAALTITAYWASGGRAVRFQRGLDLWLIGIGLAATMVVGASGALAALGDTLFPVQSLAEGIRQDFSPTAHFLVRLRILHPTISIMVGIYLILSTGAINLRTKDAALHRIARILTILVTVQLGAGFLNVLLLAPVWMQILHLLLADLVWIALVLLAAINFAVQGEPVSNRNSTSVLQGSRSISV